MFTSIEITGLRGITSCKIEGLAPMVLLVGPNGCGKSTVLEAFGVLCAGANAAEAFNALSQREWLGLDGVKSWFTGAKFTAECNGIWRPTLADAAEMKADVRLAIAEVRDADLIATAHARGYREPLLEFDASANGASSSVALDSDGDAAAAFANGPRWFPYAAATSPVDRAAGAKARLDAAGFSSELREALTSLKRGEWYDRFLENLQVLKPRVASIESLAIGARDEPHVIEREPRAVYPLAYAGDGFRRAMVVCATLARAQGGVAAIDEPEAFAHPRLFQALAQLFRRSVDDDTQIVVATHSLEFVSAVLAAFADAPEKACVVGLRRDNGAIDPLVVSGPDAQRRVLEFGDDLRL